MSAKTILVLCAQAVLIQFVASQCIGREPVFGMGIPGPYGPGWGYDGLASFDGLGYGAAWGGLGPVGPGCAGIAPATGLAASYGGGLAITSASPIAPTGLSVNSENAIEGTLAVIGHLPFLGAVATDGAFPSVGAGAVSYGCGDGAIGIVAEAPIAAPAVGPAFGYGPGLGPYGYGPAGYNGIAALGGCGCGAIY